MEKISEESVLKHFDNSIIGDYNDFIDLGHGYYELANCRLTLFKDKDDWAMVFEKFAYNVQFHPESIMTPLGKEILQNFIQIARYE